MTMRELIRVAGLCACVFVLVGCSASKSSAETTSKYHFDPSVLSGDRPAALGAGRRPQQILVLSGGGSNGAWGAGVLCGWSESKVIDRPQFDLVTGISTGSLMATAAFLGKEYDGELKLRYTTTRTRDIYRERFILFALFGSSLLDTKPLKHLIEESVPDTTIDKVGEALASGRHLVVGSVSLASGQLVMWDLTELAADKSNPRRYETYRQILLASAAIPVAFPPVSIDGELHVDGGAHALLFLRDPLLEPNETGEGHLRIPGPTIWVIVNGRVSISRKDSVKAKLLPIAMRSVESLMSSTTRGALLEIETLALKRRLDAKMSVPSDELVDSMDSNEFDPVKMSRLFEAGRAWGQQVSEWPKLKAPD